MLKEVVEQLLSPADVIVNGDRPWDIHIHDQRFYQRLLKDGSLGLGESFMEGWWSCPSVDQFIERVLSAKIHQKIKKSLRLSCAVLWAKLFSMQSHSK